VGTKQDVESKEVALLERMLLVQLYSLGVTQGQIAQFMGKSKTWVNESLQGLPKKRSANE
jgi:predicted transcriptional regulator